MIFLSYVLWILTLLFSQTFLSRSVLNPDNWSLTCRQKKSCNTVIVTKRSGIKRVACWMETLSFSVTKLLRTDSKMMIRLAFITSTNVSSSSLCLLLLFFFIVDFLFSQLPLIIRLWLFPLVHFYSMTCSHPRVLHCCRSCPLLSCRLHSSQFAASS